jgi:exonuclease SbcD
MDKLPLAIWITDIHLSLKTMKTVKYIFEQVQEICLQMEHPTLILGGDIFDSRSGQPQEVLTCFSEILQNLEQKGIKTLCIPGNHDRVDYTKEDSYLDAYSGWNEFILIKDYFSINVSEHNLRFHFIPYFDEKLTYGSYLAQAGNNLDLTKKNILFTHIAISGVKNNDGSKIENNLTRDSFKHFHRVVVGHYHNRQVFDNILYTGSAYQNNHGEDIQKGCSVVYSDGSIEFLKLDFPEYRTQKFTLNEFMSMDESDFIVDQDINLRLKIQGKPDFEQSKKIQKLEARGIKIECEYEVVTQLGVEDVKSNFTDKDIEDYFEEWCVLEGIQDKQFGLNLYNGA